MALKHLFRKIWHGKRGFNINDETREISLQSRRRNSELKDLKHQIETMRVQREFEQEKADLEDLQDELYPEEEQTEETADQKILNLIMNLVQKQPSISSLFSKNVNNEPTLEPQNLINFTNEEILCIIEEIPKKQIKQAKKLDDETLRQLVKARIPMINQDSVERTLSVIREY